MSLGATLDADVGTPQKIGASTGFASSTFAARAHAAPSALEAGARGGRPSAAPVVVLDGATAFARSPAAERRAVDDRASVIESTKMPWIEAMLRGQRVLAKAGADGALVAEGGRVEIRYKPTDGRAYRAAQANLEIASGAAIHPDDFCAAADAAPDKNTAKKSAAAAAAARVDPKTTWIVYADGACSGNPGPAGAGFVVIPPGGSPREGFEYLGEGTNNIAELTAILRAVEAIPDDGNAVAVHTDSQYSIGVLQKGWKAKANQELVARVKSAVQKRGAKLVYVPGHAGVAMNERADALAREAVSTRRSQRID